MIKSERELEAQEWKNLAKEVALDLWVCRHFNVLPTEERFQKLTPNQKALLFYGYLETPTDEAIHTAYQREMSERKLINKETEEQFAGLGYTSEQIERIKENAKAAGMM